MFEPLELGEYQKQALLSQVSWDLSEAGKEKLAGLAEGVEFESEEVLHTEAQHPEGILHWSI